MATPPASLFPKYTREWPKVQNGLESGKFMEYTPFCPGIWVKTRRISLERRKMIEHHVAEWRRSGLSQNEYARLKNLPQTTLSRWCRERENQNSPASLGQASPPLSRYGSRKSSSSPEVKFVQVSEHFLSMARSRHTRNGRFVLHVDHRFQLSIPDDFSTTTLEKIIRILGNIR